MSTTATDINSKTQNFNKILVHGRIESSYVTKNDNHRTQVTLPAPTEFDRPQVIPVISKASLGSKGETIKVICSISGYARTYAQKDGSTGIDNSVLFIAENK